MDSATAGLVMATFNSRSFVEESIQSVMNQDFTDFVCCVVDDGSTDGTADFVREVVSEDNRFAVVEQSHAGVSAARNLGASRLPATKYVSFPDSDDLWRPQALRTLIDSAELFGGVGAHALADEIDANGTVLDSGAAALRRERFISGVFEDARFLSTALALLKASYSRAPSIHLAWC